MWDNDTDDDDSIIQHSCSLIAKAAAFAGRRRFARRRRGSGLPPCRWRRPSSRSISFFLSSLSQLWFIVASSPSPPSLSLFLSLSQLWFIVASLLSPLSLSLFLSLLWFIVASALSLALSPPYCCVVFTIVTP